MHFVWCIFLWLPRLLSHYFSANRSFRCSIQLQIMQRIENHFDFIILLSASFSYSFHVISSTRFWNNCVLFRNYSVLRLKWTDFPVFHCLSLTSGLTGACKLQSLNCRLYRLSKWKPSKRHSIDIKITFLSRTISHLHTGNRYLSIMF